VKLLIVGLEGINTGTGVYNSDGVLKAVLIIQRNGRTEYIINNVKISREIILRNRLLNRFTMPISSGLFE
jgi:hypothetical protein